MTILYIHGFASCGSGSKVQALREYFGEDLVLSPDLPPEPEMSIKLLQDLISDHGTELLIGSSLGGYYAEYLNRMWHIPSVLINPATRPFATLISYTGINTNWCTGQEFEWLAEYNHQLEAMYRESPAADERYLVLLQAGDEILDYRLALNRYQHHRVIVEQGGNHRFENLSDYMSDINEFWKGY